MSNKSINTGMAPPARIKPRSRTATRKLTLMPVVVSVRGETLTVTLDPHSQHTLSWREEVAGLLPPGNCNLFSYPKVVAKPEHVLAITENQRKEQMARRVGIARAVIGAGICRGGRTIRLSKEGKEGRDEQQEAGAGLVFPPRPGDLRHSRGSAHESKADPPTIATAASSTTSSTTSSTNPMLPRASVSATSPMHGRVSFEDAEEGRHCPRATSCSARASSAEASPSSSSSSGISSGGKSGRFFHAMAIPRPPKALLEKASTTPKALLEKGKHELIFFRDLGFSESFFEVAEDANGAWHNDDLLEFDLNAEQLQVLDELVFAVAMLGRHSVMSVDNEGREAEQSRISEGMVQSLHEVTAKSPNGSRTTGFKLRPGSIDPFRVPDASGAYPMHALFIANSDAALDLGMRILAQRHDLITQVHDPGKFTNENVLHILAANRQHEAFANLVALASRVLDDAGLQRLLLTQADGSFFLEPPMCDFGGSPVGFACYFGGIAAIRALLNNRRTRDLVDLNSSTLLCRRSGFLVRTAMP